MQPHTRLSLEIKRLYPDQLQDADVMDAAKRLVSFFKILVEVDRQTKKPKEAGIGGITKSPNNP